MALAALQTWVFLGLFGTLIVFGFLSYRLTPENERQALACLAKTKLPSFSKTVSCSVAGGQRVELAKSDVERLSKPYLTKLTTRSKWVGAGCLLVFGLIVFGLWGFTRRKGKELVTDTHLRGAKRISSEELRLKVLEAKMASDLKLGGVPLLKDREVEHMVISGATGSGKSVAIKELMDVVRARGQAAIVYDTSGEFVSQYYRDGKDIILNPFDSRSPKWSLWSEIRQSFDYDTVAASLIPSRNSDDPFWSTAARTLFSSIARRLDEQNNQSEEALFHYANTVSLKELHQFLDGTPAAPLMDPASEKTAASIRATLANAIRMWPYLAVSNGKELFSVRKFVEESSNSDAWLFITCRADQHALLRPLLSCWIAQAVTATLSLKESRERRLWFFLDELASLNKISISDLLERGRKYGAACVLGFQTMSQLRSIYGNDDSSTILQNCKTGLFLQAVDTETAKAVSAACGSEEILETGESQTLSHNNARDGFNLTRRRVIKPTVLDSEFLRMPKLTGILRLPDDYPVSQIRLIPKDRPIQAPEFVCDQEISP